MRILGGVSDSGIQFDIRQVNFGSDTISNYDYFKPRMSTALQTALTNKQNAYDTYTSQFTTNLDLLKQYNAELNTLNNQLKDIQSQVFAQDQVIGASVSSHYGRPPISNETDYVSYQNAITQLAILKTQETNKQTEINNKNSQITSTQNTLDSISLNVAPSNFFTQELLDELDCFTFQNEDYVDDSFIETSELSKDKIIEMKLQLMDNGNKELLRMCRPQSEFKTTLKNLWSLRDEKDCLISYETWRSKFKAGNLVTIMPSEDFYVTVRIIGIELDYDDLENATVIFSNRTRLDDSVYILGEIQAQASRAFSSVQINKYANKEAASNTASFKNFQNGIFNATLNKMVSDDKSQVETSEYGIKIRPWLEADNTYGLRQMWLNPWRMLFTNDGFKTADSAFGLLTLPDGGEEMGVNTKYLIGKILMTENTYIENESGTYSFDKNGFLSSSTIGSNTYSVNINPSSPANIFNIAVNNVAKLYVDTISNRLKFSGDLEGANGTFSGSLSGATGTFSGTITAGVSITSPIINGGTISGTKLTSTASGSERLEIDGAYIQGWNSLGANKLNIDYNGNITCSSVSANSMSMNGSVVLSVGNLASQCSSNNIYVPKADYAVQAGTAFSATSSSSCSTGYLTLSSGTLEAPAGSLWIGQNTVKANTIEQLSSEKYKNNINIYNGNALDLICNTAIKTYNYIIEEDGVKAHLGMIVEEAPTEVISESGESLDIGALASLSWKAIQELNTKIKTINDRLSII